KKVITAFALTTSIALFLNETKKVLINAEEIEINPHNKRYVNCQELEKIVCYETLLNSTDFLLNLSSPEKVKCLDLGDNNFESQDLSFLKLKAIREHGKFEKENEKLPKEIENIEKYITEIKKNIKLLETNSQQVVNTYITVGDINVGNTIGGKANITNQYATKIEELETRIEIVPK
ncbi:16859_t:CDS:2, partial [Entrophospora sp. SA101]